MLPKRRLTGMWRILAYGFAAALLFLAASCGKKRNGMAPVPPRIGTTQQGIASWYGEPYHGRRAANGEIYDMNQLTAAHRKWAFDTIVRVTNLSNRKEVEVRITDRGPFVKGRIIDLSREAARNIELIGPGVTKVKLKVVRYDTRTPKATRTQKTEPAKIKSSAPTTARFVVQAGAFRGRERADSFREQLRTLFPDARIAPRARESGVWRVIIGNEPTLQQAEELKLRVRQQAPDAIIVNVDGDGDGVEQP